MLVFEVLLTIELSNQIIDYRSMEDFLIIELLITDVGRRTAYIDYCQILKCVKHN